MSRTGSVALLWVVRLGWQDSQQPLAAVAAAAAALDTMLLVLLALQPMPVVVAVMMLGLYRRHRKKEVERLVCLLRSFPSSATSSTVTQSKSMSVTIS